MSYQSRKIMFVIPSLEGGGAERVAANLLKGFSESGIESLLVLFDERHSYGIPDSVKVRYLNIGEHKNVVCKVFLFFLIIFRLVKVIREERPFNILSFMDYTNIVVILSNILAGGKARTTITVHISPTLHLHKYTDNIWNSLISVMMRLFYNRADTVVTVSLFIRDDLIRNYGVKETKVVPIYNPIDMDKIRKLGKAKIAHPWFSGNIPVVLSAGRLTRQKGFDYLLKAFALVRERTNARLVILGEGEDEADLKELSKKLGIDKDVDFPGFQENPYNFMKHSALYVLSSLYEGFPVVLIEAMACALPVVSTIYNPDTDEIIEHEKNGLLVPAEDESALADAMLRMLGDVKERESFAYEAGKKVEGLSLEKIVAQYKRILLDGR